MSGVYWLLIFVYSINVLLFACLFVWPTVWLVIHLSVRLFIYPFIWMFASLSAHQSGCPSVHLYGWLFLAAWLAIRLSVRLLIQPYFCPSLFLSSYPYVRSSVWPWFWPIYSSIRPSVDLSVCLSARQSPYLTVRLSIHPYVCLSACSSVCSFYCPIVLLLYLINMEFERVFCSRLCSIEILSVVFLVSDAAPRLKRRVNVNALKLPEVPFVFHLVL